jgi:16S rRNA (cytidine1402-2'-O)-methyltransferase
MLLREALARASLKDAVAEVAALTGLPRRDVYQQALSLAKASGGAINQRTGDGPPR